MLKMNDIPFTPLFKPETLENAKKWFVETKPKFGSTGNFAVLNDEGQILSRVKNGCHAAINRPTIDNRSLVATAIRWNTKEKTERSWETVLPFLKWFLYESCYGRFIVNRNDIDFIKEYGIIVSADLYTPIMQNILIISRHFFEIEPHVFERFNSLVTSGVPGNIAYPICFNTGLSYGVHSNLDTAVTSWESHRASPLFNLKAFQNFLAGRVGTLLKETDILNPDLHYRKSASYYGGLKLFREGEELPDSSTNTPLTFCRELIETNKEFKEALSERRKDLNSADLYRPPNPFIRTKSPPLAANDCSYKEMYDFVIPYLMTKGIL